MYFVVHHDICNTEDFWASAQRNLPKLPEGGVKNAPAYGKPTQWKTWKNISARRSAMPAAIRLTKSMKPQRLGRDYEKDFKQVLHIRETWSNPASAIACSRLLVAGSSHSASAAALLLIY
jgi:hypothetical protein